MARDNVNNQYETAELACIASLRTKLPPDNSVVFYYCTLEDAINSITSNDFDERKILLLYLHNSSTPFSKMFLQHLKAEDKLSQVLRRSYLVVGWDLDNHLFHEHLVKVLNRYPILSSISEFITKQVAAAFCIVPYDTSINLASCLRIARIASTVDSLEGVEKLYEEHLKAEQEEKELEAKTSSENDLSPEKMQGIWADMLGNRDYDCFEHNEHEALKDKIGFALKGSPLEESGYDKKQKKEIEKLYQKIKIESSKIAECKGRVEIAVFYACLVPLPEEKIAKSKKYSDYTPINDWTPLPVFRLRKCRKNDTIDQNERLPCSIIIDHTGRVYQTWISYLTNNKYPKGHIIVPKNGRYQCNCEDSSLENHLSPACHITKKLLAVGDVTSIVATVGSAAITVGATIPALAALPVLGPPVLVGAAVTGGIGVLWTLGRTIHNLVDRSQHSEELSFANSEARGAYLNIMACSLGFVGAGANVALSQLISRGVNVGKGAAFAFNSISVLNLGVSGASLANSTYDVLDRLINDKEAPSPLALMQLSASVLFFAHAASNFKSAQTIIDETQAKVLQNYQDLLRSNRHRKMFSKLLKESIRVHGDETKGMAEVILSMRKIPDKNEVFAALTRNNKVLNENGVKFAANNGEIYFNGMKVDMNQFVGLSGKQTEFLLVNLGQEPIPLQNSSASPSLKLAVANVLSDFKVDVSSIDLLQVVNLTVGIVRFLNEDVRVKIVEAVHQALDYYLLKYGQGLIEVIDNILPKDAQYIQVLNVGITYFRRGVNELEQQYQLYQQTGNQQYYSSVFDKINPEYLKRTITFFEWVVRNSYSAERLTYAVVEEIAKFIHSWIAKIIFEKNEKDAKENEVEEYTREYEVSKVDCQVCEGHYFKPL